MRQDSYTRTRKIQIQDVKGSVKGLFPEDEMKNKTANQPIKKGFRLPALFRAKDRTGRDDRRQGHVDVYQPDELSFKSKVYQALKQLRQTTQKMYHADGSFAFIIRFFRSITNHIRTGRTMRVIQGQIHTNFYDKPFEKWLFKLEKPKDTPKNIENATDLKAETPRHKPVSVKLLKTILSNLPDKLNHFHFMGVASGVGRSLLIASCYPFKKVIGVDTSKDMHDRCRSNIAHFPRSMMQCRDVQSTQQKLLSETVPKQNTVFLFEAPFKMRDHQEMIANITQAYKEQPRRFYLIFIEPLDSQNLDTMLQKSHIYEPFEIAALNRWPFRWLNPFTVRIYRTVYQERS